MSNNFWDRLMADMESDNDKRNGMVNRLQNELNSINNIWYEAPDGENVGHRNQRLASRNEFNLPTEPIEKSNGHCHGCGNDDLLGNKLCVKCWDYVVDNSSTSSKKWPNEMQYHAIKAR